MPADRVPEKIKPMLAAVVAMPAQRPELPEYAELHCRSNFSFLTGASHPAELVHRAMQLGYRALGLTDECSVAGVVRAHAEVKSWPKPVRDLFRFIVGSQFDLQKAADTPGCRLVLLAQNRNGYGNLCELITLARLRSEKGQYRIDVRDLDAPETPFSHLRGMPDCFALLIPRRDDPPGVLLAQARWLKSTFGERARIAVELLMWSDDGALIERLLAVSNAVGLPLVAAGDVLMHVRSRKPMQDTLTAVRLKRSIADCGFALARNAEQHLRSRLRLSRIYRSEWLQASVEIAAACTFSLDSLGYEYPAEIVPKGQSPISHLRSAHRGRPARALPEGHSEAGTAPDREGAGADRGASATRPSFSPCTTSCASRARRAFCAKAAARRRTRQCAIASASLR